jgi:hypothetical protein
VFFWTAAISVAERIDMGVAVARGPNGSHSPF